MPKQKDRPLRLRRKQDGKLYLMGEWPPRHEFSTEWLLQNTLDGSVLMSDKEISLELANASAVYAILQAPGEDGDMGKMSGYWAKLKEGKVT